MKNRWLRFVCLVLVGLLVSGKAAYALDARRLAHDLQHVEQAAASQADHDHAGHFHAGADEPEAADVSGSPAPLSDSEHRLLHLAAGAQLAMPASVLPCAVVWLTEAAELPPQARPPRHRAIEPPRRPPRA